ncbi:MAG: hypothetical protein IJA65_02920 [Acholeplasmatales bacterium]|nr:hypothetical protein [Acholeplasmatales bacterium]
MKKISIIILFFFSLIFLSCSNSTGGKLITINASKIGESPTKEEKTFKSNGSTFAYSNVYKNENNFVILPGGYIKTINGQPDSLVRFYANEYISVLCCDSDGALLDPLKYASEYGKTDGRQCYILAESSNFMIMYDSNASNELNLGKLIFWC